jgi:hypothetical protein
VDGDGICGDIDNCPSVSNFDQTDTDSDGLGDVCDTCPNDYDNDVDGDGICGNVDACPNDPDNDVDGDGVCGDIDNCPSVSNFDQTDADSDGAGDLCDTCPNDPDNDDVDGDGVCSDVDNCPTDSNADQADTDLDGLGNVCDNDTLPQTAHFNWYRGAGCFEILFDASDSNGTTYEWDFGDGSTGFGEMTSHNYVSDEGSHIVKLTVDESRGRAREITVKKLDWQVGLPARIWGPPSYYLTLQEACDNAADYNLIQSKNTFFNGDLQFNSAVTVFYEAGYDCGYSTIEAGTTIEGNMTISDGTFAIQGGLLRVQ